MSDAARWIGSRESNVPALYGLSQGVVNRQKWPIAKTTFAP